jgi:hypothetical protein
MKLAIVGTRSFTDYEKFKEIVERFFYHALYEHYIPKEHRIEKIISGGARGTDSLAARFAEEKQVELVEYLPDWEKFGKSAGCIRNQFIIKEADFVLAFWTGAKRGSGTYHDIVLAKKYRKPTLIIYV